MPKMKTHKAGAKRYRVTANGKVMRAQAFRGHLNVNKAGSRKRRLNKDIVISTANEKKIRLELPYPKYSR
jgi:large subunit ribosomal protein L35